MRREFKRIGEVMRKAITPKYGKEFSASTGLSDGTVDAGGGWMWCVMDSSGQPIKAYNGNKVPVQARLKVKLGYQKGDPRVLRILRVRNVWDEIIPSALGYHGSTHTFPAPDTVWVDQAQYIPLMVQPKSGFVVSIMQGVIQWGANVVTVQSQDFDLSADYVTTGARWALIQADNTGTVSRKLGALVDTQWLLTDADIPAPDTDNVALAAIMLYTGQELISRNQYVNDVRDLRTWYSGTGGGGTGDVTGPASAVDGNLAVFDGTTGKVIKDGGAPLTLDDAISGVFSSGSNVITNGSFATDASGWTLGAGWAWESDGAGGGRVRHTPGNTDPFYQSGLLISGAAYLFGFSIGGGSAGTVSVSLDDGQLFVFPYSAGDVNKFGISEWAESYGAKIIFSASSDFDGYIYAVSVYRLAALPEPPRNSASGIYGRGYGQWHEVPPVTRAIITTAPLSGGGDLSADRTLSISAATTGAAGSMSAADKTKLDGIAAGAEVNVNADWSAVSGDAQILNKPTLGGAAALNVGTTAGTVAAGDDSRLSDARTPTAHAASHKSGGADAIKLDELAAPTDVTTLNASTSAHGLAPKATAPAAGLLNLLGIGNGETVYSNKAIFDMTNPAALGTAGPGTSLVAARRDHVHAMPSASDVGAVPSDGWIASSATWSYSSLDSAALTGVISVNADMTGLVSVGDRISYVQTSTKHGIITKVGAYSGGATLITFFYGNNTAFANAAITSPKYSHSKTPFGFPTDPTLWTVLVTDTSDRSQSNPTQDQYYNLGSLSITVPIGVWRLGFTTLLSTSKANAQVSMQSALSTSTSSVSDARLLGYAIGYGTTVVRNQVISFRALSIASKTTYYLISRTSTASVTDISLLGASITTVMYAECLLL